MSELPPIPLILRTRLAHATLQAVADECGADILHIKGAAVDESLLPPRVDALETEAAQRALPRLSADADVLVRPLHLSRFLAGVSRNGWHKKNRFDTGGGAHHSADFWHDELGWADVHRSFPGIRRSPDLAFDRLWQDHGTREIAHRPCHVPSREAQRLILLLHAARNGGTKESDVREAWLDATGVERQHVHALANQLGAEVALAAATGNLDDYSDRSDYDLWRLLSGGDANQFEVWAARIKAAPTWGERALTVVNPLRLKPDAVAQELQRKPTAVEVVRFYGRRLRRDLEDVLSLAKKRASSQRPT